MRAFVPLALAAAAVVLPATSAAQTAPAAPSDIDPARLAEARKLIDIMMPPALREQMIENIMASMGQTMMQLFMEDTKIQRLLEEKPGAREVMERYLERNQKATVEALRQDLPSMFEAMARAYARRFTIPQMREMGAFFATPTGQLYITESAKIFNDPDVSNWMQQFMRKRMEQLPEETSTLRQELEALD